MHMRTKKWAKPELESCSWYTETPEEYRGKWKAQFERVQPLFLEVGCGKGVATAQMVAAEQDKNYLAVDVACNVLGDARRNIVKALNNDEASHVRLIKGDVAFIDKFIAPEDDIERIYIQFCNPWSEHARHEKRRLTHPRQLMQYRSFLRDEGEIWFKTDDDTLFDDSLIYFSVCGFEVKYLTWDLHADGFEPNYLSEHEKKFAAQGIPIKFGIFVKKTVKVDIDPIRWRGRERHGKETDRTDQ